MTHRRQLEFAIYQIFSKMVEKTIHTVYKKGKDFQQTYRVVGTETHEIVLTVRRQDEGKTAQKDIG